MSALPNEKLAKLTMHVMEHDKLPMMQVVLMKIDGVEYELFGPIISDEQRDVGNLQEITFSEVVPLPIVISYLTSLLIGSDPELRKKMQ
jgi:hypothetical protein